MPGDHSKPENWAAEDKLAIIIETAGLNSAQLSEYCRSKGLYLEQIDQWKTATLSGYQHNTQVEEEKIRSRREDRKQIKRLESELRRKEKALAETAALLVLSKKREAIWGQARKINIFARSSDSPKEASGLLTVMIIILK